MLIWSSEFASREAGGCLEKLVEILASRW